MSYLPADKRTFSLVPATDYTSQQETSPWLIRPFLRVGSSMMIYGRQGTGKSRLSWQLAYAFASGSPWLGFQIERPGPVIFLEVDMPESDLQQMIDNAAAYGINHPEIHLIHPKTPVGDYFDSFDVLKHSDRVSLASFIHDIKPVLLVIDTGNDVFRTRPGDVNDQVRHVLRTLRSMMQGYGALVYLNHERKKPQTYSKSSEDDSGSDKDVFMGAQAWEGVATTSLRLKNVDESTQSKHKTLLFKKHRLGPPGFEQLSLEMTKPYGFFEAKLTIPQALMLWQGDTFAGPHSYKEVFTDVAAQVGATEEAVKKAFQRQRESGVEHPWLSQLEGDKA